MKYRYKPTRAQKDAYIEAVTALEAWIDGPGRALHAVRAGTGTVYFEVNGNRYRIASHRPGDSYDNLTHPEISYHAAPTRAPEIANAIVAGIKLDGRGRPKRPET